MLWTFYSLPVLPTDVWPKTAPKVPKKTPEGAGLCQKQIIGGILREIHVVGLGWIDASVSAL